MTVRSTIPLLVAWGLCLAALAGFHLGYVLPRERALADGQDQLRTRTARCDLLTHAKSPKEQQRLQSRQDEIQQQYAGLVFSGEEVSRIDFAIREMAEKNGLTDFSGRPLGTTTALGTTKFTHVAQRELTLSFTGKFPEFLHFVNELERHQPVVFVDNINLRTVTGQSAPLACDLEGAVLYPGTGN